MQELFNQMFQTEITVVDVLIMLAFSLLLGGAVSLVYKYTKRDAVTKPGFTLTLFMLPAVISIIIMMVGSNVARAFSLAGAFSIVRFRSMPGDPDEIAYIFFSLAIGLGCGIGFIGYSVLFTVLMCLILTARSVIASRPKHTRLMQLNIDIPENLNYSHVLDDILSQNTESYKFNKIKTSEYGTVYMLYYTVKLSDMNNQKQLIDSLRTRNGNLPITLTEMQYMSE
ncbi:MAG: DUF4956 domain-containing protein [Firmicutes bacterium]|nr:DUF4956 domain-containing protein [Bacillota bacterium]